jgi:hypothetical protein
MFYLEAIAAGPEAVTRRFAVHLKFAHNIVALSRAAALDGEGQELSELHALAVVGALHQLIYSQLHENGPDSLLEIADDVVQIAVAFLTVRMPPGRRSIRRRRTGRAGNAGHGAKRHAGREAVGDLRSRSG